MTRRISYRPELDGLRGLAILMVMGHHINVADARLLPGGFVGVDLFFVLSGALITTILLREHAAAGAINFKGFYWRRVTRLFPALAVMLGFCVIFTWLRWSPEAAAEVRLDSLYAVFYLSSFVNIERPARLLTTTWSLSIEEWFYSLWPLLVAGLVWRRKQVGLRTLALGVVLLSVAIFTWRFYLAEVAFVSFRRIYFGLDTHSDGLLIGALVAIALEAGWSGRKAAVTAGAWIGCGTLALAAYFARWHVAWFAVVGYTGVALASGLLVLFAMQHRSRLLSLPPLVYVGKISYSLYLWLLPVFSFAAGLPRVAQIALLFAVSAGSYHLVEQNGLRLRNVTLKAG